MVGADSVVATAGVSGSPRGREEPDEVPHDATSARSVMVTRSRRRGLIGGISVADQGAAVVVVVGAAVVEVVEVVEVVLVVEVDVVDVVVVVVAGTVVVVDVVVVVGGAVVEVVLVVEVDVVATPLVTVKAVPDDVTVRSRSSVATTLKTCEPLVNDDKSKVTEKDRICEVLPP